MGLEAMREKQVNIRCSPEEWERFERVAKHHGLNAANVVRMLVKREDDVLAATSSGHSRASDNPITSTPSSSPKKTSKKKSR